jgi:hypothetical protein
MCIDWYFCYWRSETQARSRRVITCGPNCEKEQQLNIHSAFSIREGTAIIAGYYKATLSDKYRHGVQIKCFKYYT